MKKRDNTTGVSFITTSTPAFATRKDVLQLFFRNYPTGRHPCSYDLPGGSHDLWFPNLVTVHDTAENHGWSNVLSADGKTLVERNADPSRHTPRPAPRDRIVFGFKKGEGYCFIGIFQPAFNEDYKTEGYRYIRIATGVFPKDYLEPENQKY